LVYSKNAWDQLKGILCDDLIGFLKKDGWVWDVTIGASQAYIHPQRKKRITVHYHPNKSYGPSLLKALLEDIGWTEKDMKRLKVIK
jgi:predicted RNA binding protein YcfA (HicA-like mRNA interferase family)